jgi:AraC-like DNA-binding protein
MPSTHRLHKSPSLDHYVSDIQLVEADLSDPVPFVTYGYPEATAELLIVLSGGLLLSYRNNDYRVDESCCFTFIEEPSKVTVSQDFSCIRVVFKPLGVLPLVGLTGLSSQELISKPIIGVSEFVNPSISRLISEINETTKHADIAGLINESLVSQLLMKPSLLSHLGESLLTASTVDDLCEHLCCTPRTLQRWFKNEMGISPKYFLRLLRFKHTLSHLASPSPAHPIAVAHNLGYYDHNHLIKEVQHFAQSTPGQLSFDHYLPVQMPSA